NAYRSLPCQTAGLRTRVAGAPTATIPTQQSALDRARGSLECELHPACVAQIPPVLGHDRFRVLMDTLFTESSLDRRHAENAQIASRQCKSSCRRLRFRCYGSPGGPYPPALSRSLGFAGFGGTEYAPRVPQLS